MLSQLTAPAIATAPIKTAWYYVSVVTDDLHSFYLELAESFLGLGHKDEIHAAAAARFPGCVVMDWRLCRPQA